MKKRIPVLSYITLIGFIICFFTIKEETIFYTYIGILVSLLFVISLYFSISLLVQFNEGEEKETVVRNRNFLIYLPFVTNIIFLLITQVYAFGEITDFMTPVIIIFFIEVVLFIGYIIASILIDKTIVNDTDFTSKNIFQKGEITIPYDEITQIKFGWLMNTFQVKTKSKTALVDVTMKNASYLLNKISKHTSLDIHQQAFESLGTYFRLLMAEDNKTLLNYFKKNQKG